MALWYPTHTPYIYIYMCVCCYADTLVLRGWLPFFVLPPVVLFSQSFKRMQGLESVFMPGGDGGSLNWTIIPIVAAALREARGNNTSAGIWLSAQELSATAMDQFWANVSAAARHVNIAIGPNKHTHTHSVRPSTSRCACTALISVQHMHR